LALLDSVRENNGRIFTLHSLLARMTAGVWYPVNYFWLSFGKQDQLAKITTLLGQKRASNRHIFSSALLFSLHPHRRRRRAIISCSCSSVPKVAEPSG
jgi:hypothetical protein